MRRHPDSARGRLDEETVEAGVPGRLGDRKTPLGELNWIFTAVTDTIAWNVLPARLFQRLVPRGFVVGFIVPELPVGGTSL